MKNKKGLKGVAIIIALLSMLGLCGCAINTPKQREEDNAKALEFLEKKYDKEFRISESVHTVGTASGELARFRQGHAYCVDNPDETFFVYIDNEDEKVYKDTYQNITIRPYAQEYYEKIIEKKWNNCKIWVELTCLATKDEIYSKDNYEPFLTNEGGTVSTEVFLQNNDDNTEKEAEDIYSLSKEMKEKGLKGIFYYYYMTDNSKIDNEEINNRNEEIEDCIKKGIIMRFCKIYINERDSLNIEEIKNELDKKDF